MQSIFIFIIIFIAAILQTSFLPNFFPAGAVPDVALILVIIWTAASDFNAVFKRAILAGLVVDLVSFWPVGVNILSFVAVAFVINSLSKRFLVAHETWKFFILSVMIVIGALVNAVAIFGLMKFFSALHGQSPTAFSFFGAGLMRKVLYDLVIFAAIYWPFGKLERFFIFQNKKIIIQR